MIKSKLIEWCRILLFVQLMLLYHTIFAQTESEFAARRINFAGCEWIVRDVYGGPGPNHWSDSEQSVWLDESGRLHLKIRSDGVRWYCAEVYTRYYTTYGEHRFLIEGDPNLFDKNVVLGLFTYANDEAEIDIEFSRWGDANLQKIGSFTVQPYTVPNNSKQFAVGEDVTKSTHYFRWNENYILFGSYKGHHYSIPDPINKLSDWVYWGDYIPTSSENLRTHINLWLFQGHAPTNLDNLEIIITDVMHPLRTDVGTNEPGVPESLHLPQNYPNPFIHSTNIRPNLNHDKWIDIKLYNVLGEEISQLKDQCNVGEIKLDVRGLPSGVYLYEIKGHESNNVRFGKMMILN